MRRPFQLVGGCGQVAPGAAGTTTTTTHSDVLAHVAGIPVEEALLAAPALLAGVTVIAGYVRATAARPRR